jgi:hypothetical protein
VRNTLHETSASSLKSADYTAETSGARLRIDTQ